MDIYTSRVAFATENQVKCLSAVTVILNQLQNFVLKKLSNVPDQDDASDTSSSVSHSTITRVSDSVCSSSLWWDTDHNNDYDYYSLYFETDLTTSASEIEEDDIARGENDPGGVDNDDALPGGKDDD